MKRRERGMLEERRMKEGGRLGRKWETASQNVNVRGTIEWLGWDLGLLVLDWTEWRGENEDDEQ